MPNLDIWQGTQNALVIKGQSSATNSAHSPGAAIRLHYGEFPIQLFACLKII